MDQKQQKDGTVQSPREFVRAACWALVLAGAALLGGCSHSQAATGYSWNAGAAAKYLDQCEAKWETWPGAARDNGTFCISCQTALSCALSRPVIQAPGEERTASAEESKLIEDVRKRVRLWQQVGPYYWGKFDESRETEAALNVLILATSDAQNGGSLSLDTRTAFDNI